MTNASFTRRISLCIAGVALAGMGLTVGCSAKQSPAPTAPVQESVDSKRPKDANPEPAKSQQPAKPPVKAKPAPTAEPGNN